MIFVTFFAQHCLVVMIEKFEEEVNHWKKLVLSKVTSQQLSIAHFKHFLSLSCTSTEFYLYQSVLLFLTEVIGDKDQKLSNALALCLLLCMVFRLNIRPIIFNSFFLQMWKVSVFLIIIQMKIRKALIFELKFISNKHFLLLGKQEF